MVEKQLHEQRRQHLLHVFERAARNRLADALPELEGIIINKPFISGEEFNKELKIIASQFVLSAEQQSQARKVFEHYQQDINDLRAYRDGLAPDLTAPSPNPLEDIKKDPGLLRQVLRHIDVKGLDQEVTLDQFELVTDIPSCLIIRCKGNITTLRKAMGYTEPTSAVGFFCPDLEPTEDELNDPSTLQQIKRLNGKLIVVFDDSRPYPEKNDPEETLIHEIEHYKFELYFKEVADTTVQSWVERRILDEIHSYFSTQQLPLHLDALLPNYDIPEYLGGGHFRLTEQPQVLDTLMEALFQIERLLASEYQDKLKIAQLAVVSESLNNFTTELKKWPLPKPVDAIYVFENLLRYCPDPHRKEMALDNLRWIETLIERVFQEQTQADKTNFLSHLDHYLRFTVLSGIEPDHSGAFQHYLIGIEWLSQFQERLRSQGIQISEVGTLIAELNQEYQEKISIKQDQELWPSFVEILAQSGDRYKEAVDKYKKHLLGTKLKDKSERMAFQQQFLEEFKQWKDRTNSQ